MTADLDLSPEAVERLAVRLDRAAGSEVLPTVYLGDRTADWCAAQAAATLRALAAENARLRAERDAAWQAGAEAMQKVAARTAVATPATRSDKAGVVWHDGFTSGCLHAADAIRALPLPGQPKEGAPPFQAPTLDALLSVATDDEADAIRACAERLAETEGGA